MADVSAIFGILLALGIVFPGMLSAWWLLFPKAVGHAHNRLETKPGLCFWLGAGVSILLLAPVSILIALPIGPAKLMGWGITVVSLGFASLGVTGLVTVMADRLSQREGNTLSQAGAFVRAALALELAAAFPVIGWFFVIPIVTITSVGATALALLRRVPTPQGEIITAVQVERRQA